MTGLSGVLAIVLWGASTAALAQSDTPTGNCGLPGPFFELDSDGDETDADRGVPDTAIGWPILIDGCNSTTTFVLDSDRDVLITGLLRSNLPADPNAVLTARLMVNDRECLVSAIGRNKNVRSGSVGGSCSIAGQAGVSYRIALQAVRRGKASCLSGSLRAEDRPRDIYGSIRARNIGFTTVESHASREVKLAGSVTAAGWEDRTGRRFRATASLGQPPVLQADTGWLAIHTHAKKTCGFDFQTLLPANQVTRFSVESKKDKADLVSTRAVIQPN